MSYIDNQQNLTIPQEVRTFIEGILKDANMTTLDQEVREEMIKELFGRLDHFMTSVLIDNLKEEDMEAFIRLSNESKSKEEIEAFIREKVPNASEVMTNAMIEFRDTYLSGVVDARNAPPVQQTDQPDKTQNQPN